jgi:DNA-binding transcriptional ArsR family regulator
MVTPRPDHEVFAALGHPIRLALLERLRGRPGAPVHALAADFSVTRPAISLHLRVLREAGLVEEEQRGRERHYRIDPVQFRSASRWLSRYEAFWDDRLKALESHLAKKRR